MIRVAWLRVFAKPCPGCDQKTWLNKNVAMPPDREVRKGIKE